MSSICLDNRHRLRKILKTEEKFDKFVEICYKLQGFYKTVTKGYKGVRAISILKNKMISLVLAITFLLSVPAYAFAKDIENVEAPSQSVVQVANNDSVNKFNMYTNLAGYYPDDAEFEISVSNVKPNSAELAWKSENLYISYTVKQFNVITNDWDDFEVATSPSLSLKGLKEKTTYRFAIASTASGEFLGDVEFTTPAIPKPKYKLINMPLPKVSGKCKTYAYYKAVTVKSSPAYAVLNSGTANGRTYKTHTDEKTGIRMVGDCYCAALGTFYGKEKGVKYKITLSTGKSFKIILCDSKADRHTDNKNQYAVRNKDVVEFYVEKGKIPKNVRGSYDVLDQFHGDIVKIEKIVEL